MTDENKDTPQVFAVSRKAKKGQKDEEFVTSRRSFLEMGAAAVGVAVTGTAFSAAKTYGECRIKSKRLNMRNGPSTKYVIVDSLTKDEVVKLLARDKDKEWIKVEGPRVTGWVSVKYLDCEKAKIDDAPVGVVPPPMDYGKPGKPPAGEQGITYSIGTRSYTLPCGSPIPSGAVCTCNCVTSPGKKVCTCDSVCTCESVGSHYWYPN